MARKGQKFKYWTAEEKYKIIKNALDFQESITSISKKTNIDKGMIARWVRTYHQYGYEGLIPKKKPGNPMCKYSNKKTLTKEEQLEYENMKLKIENEMLKKGYLMKGDGTYVKFTKKLK